MHQFRSRSFNPGHVDEPTGCEVNTKQEPNMYTKWDSASRNFLRKHLRYKVCSRCQGRDTSQFGNGISPSPRSLAHLKNVFARKRFKPELRYMWRFRHQNEFEKQKKATRFDGSCHDWSSSSSDFPQDFAIFLGFSHLKANALPSGRSSGFVSPWASRNLV